MLKNPFAITENGEIMYIKNLNRTDKFHKFYCAKCGEELVAKMGEINVWHFAHKSKIKCGGGVQTALHQYAKKLVGSSDHLTLPALSYYDYYIFNKDKIALANEIQEYLEKDSDNRFWFNGNLLEENKYKYEWIDNEKKINDFIPDCLVAIKDKKLAVEILVNHEVDEIKTEKVKKDNIDMIEIDLSDFEFDYEYNEDFDLNRYILDEANRRWIYKSCINGIDEKIRNCIYNKGFCLINDKYTSESNKKRVESLKKRKEIQVKIEEEKRKQARIRKRKKEFVESHKELYEIRNLAKAIKILRFQSKYNNNDYNLFNMFSFGEYAFKGRRDNWQKAIFDTFIKGRKNKTIQLSKVNSWVEKYSNIEYYKEFDFLDGFSNKYEAIQDYLQYLTNIGCLENISNYSNKVSFYAELRVIEDDESELNKRSEFYFEDYKDYKCYLCKKIYNKDNLIDSFYIKHFGLDQKCFEIKINEIIDDLKNKLYKK